MGYVSDEQRKAAHASKADGGKGAPYKMISTGMSSVGPMTNMPQPIINTGYRESFQKLQNELTNVPPRPSSLIQPFSQPAQQNANQVFSDLSARQNAVGAPMMFKINK